MKNKSKILNDFLDDLFDEKKPEMEDFYNDDNLISLMDISIFLKENKEPSPEFKEYLYRKAVKAAISSQAEGKRSFNMKFAFGFASLFVALVCLLTIGYIPGHPDDTAIPDKIKEEGFIYESPFENAQNEPLLYNEYGTSVYLRYWSLKIIQ
jgi:hypothetical protein